MRSEETKVLERIEKLLVRIADKLAVPPEEKPKSQADVTVARRVFGVPVADAVDVPSGLTPEMREQQAAQQNAGRLTPGRRVDRQPVEGRGTR